MNSLNDVWNEVMKILSTKLTPTAINTWFSDCTPVAVDDCTLILRTTTDFKRDMILNRFSNQIKETLTDIFSCEFGIIVLAGDEQPEQKEKNSPIPEMDGYTFDRFIVGNSNKFAHAAAKAVSNNPGSVQYNPLMIYGKSGLGKTHLLLAIGHTIFNNNPDSKIAYIKGDDFTNQLVNSLSNAAMDKFREKYRKVDLLLVDDIQFIAGKERTQEEFFHTFNEIYEAGHQIVITSDRPPVEMTLLDDRLRTRFEGGLLADIQPPDLETRMAIIKNKAAQFGLMIPEDSVNFIAQHITENVRTLEGVVKRLTAYKEILNDKITIEHTKRAIEEVEIIGNYIPTPDRIIAETARYFDLKEQEIRGQNRSKNTAMARHVSIYLMRTLTNLSLEDIGAQLGDRTHSTVLSSIKNIEKLLETDTSIKNTIRDITSNINAV